MPIDGLKVAVTGPNGRLGSSLVRLMGCVPINSRIDDYATLKLELGIINPDVVINAAAYTNVDGAEYETDKAFSTNVIGTQILCAAMDSFCPDAFLVHISTDYIFSGKIMGRLCQVDDNPDPIGFYGLSKLGSELAVKRKDSDSVIVRTTVLYDTRSDNFAMSIYKQLEAIKNTESGEILAPMFVCGTPTYIPHLVDGLRRLINMLVDGNLDNRIYHIAGAHYGRNHNYDEKRIPISRYYFAQMIAEVFDCDTNLIKPMFGQAWDYRPQHVGLDVTESINCGIPIYTVEHGLKSFKAVMARNNSTDYRIKT